jgi:hypothetical protein
MMATYDWLPGLMPYSAATPWQPYEDGIFEVFCNDFVSNPPKIGGRAIGIESKPEVNGKHRTFWHLVSDGMPEPLRTLDFERCARIAWPRAMIIAAPNHDQLRCWRNMRGSRRNLLISLDDFSYLVVLVQRKGYYFLWTAYCVDPAGRRENNRREYEAYERSQGRIPKGLTPESG